MQMRYDKESDALFIELCKATPVDSFDYEEGVTAILDADGRVIALEILDVRDRLESSEHFTRLDNTGVDEQRAS